MRSIKAAMHIATANTESINAAIITIAKAESTKTNGANRIRRNNGIFSFKMETITGFEPVCAVLQTAT